MKRLAFALLVPLLVLIQPNAGPSVAASCSATRSATLSLSATGQKVYHYVRMTDSSHVETGGWRTLAGPVNIGAPHVAVTTCKNPSTGRWSILQGTPVNHFYHLTVTESASNGVRAVPRSGGYGWGVFAKQVTTSALKLQIRRCVSSPGTPSVLGVAHGVLGLPLPIKSIYAVGAWILDKVLPAAADRTKYYCGDMGTVDFPIAVSQTTGVPAFSSTTRSGTATWRQPHLPCYIMYCSDVWVDTVTVRRA